MALQKSPFIAARWSNFQGLTSDIDPLARANGVCDDALNIHAVTQGGNTTVSVENVLGNEFVYELPTVATQNKIFRIYIQYPSAVLRTLEFFDGNGVSLGTATYTPATSLANTYTLATTAINATLGAGNVSIGALVVTSANAEGYFSFEFTGGTSVNFWDYSLTLTTTGTEPVPIITQEAIDASLAGMLLHIGSYDVDGDLMIWSTNQRNLPSDIAVTGTANSGGLIQIQVADTTGIVAGAMVKIADVGGTVEANGIWIVSAVTATTFELLGSAFAVAWTSGGTVTINVNGLGEIGVAERNDNSSTWNYTTLLRSREFNFRTKNQPKTVCERNNNQLNCYWCDGNNPSSNPYRRFYYQGAYISNGAINYINPLGLYNYGTIYNETRLFQGNGLADIQYSDQLQSGGALYSGNYRYVVRFLDEFFNPTLWTDPSGIFVVYANTNLPLNSQTTAEGVYGNYSTVLTSKINQMNIVGIIPNLFKYVELGSLFYVDGTPVPVFTIVKRELLNQTTTQIIQHTGNETNVQIGDINTLLATQPDIFKGLNIDIVASRLIPSNTSSHSTFNFQSWVDTFQYNLKQDTIGIIVDITGGYPQNVGEYQLSTNTFNKMGFMMNETYRIACKFELLNGAFTENFWFDDILFDDSGASGKRLTGLPSMDMTDSGGTVVYIPYLEVVNINWNFQVGGVAMKDVVKRIHWEMVEMKEQFREVLAMGFASLAVASTTPPSPTVQGWTCRNNISIGFSIPNFATNNYLTDYIFMEGAYVDNGVTTLVPYGTYAGLSSFRDYFSFYSPDVMFGYTDFSFLSGDIIINFGNPTGSNSSGAFAVQTALPMIDGAFNEFFGWVDSVNFPLTTHTVQDLTFISKNGTGSVSGTNYAKTYEIHGFDSITTPGINYTGRGVVDLASSHVAKTTSVISAHGAGTDYGFNVIQYFRAKTNKFGNTNTSKYIPTGWKTEYLDTTTNVYGDVFTQKTWFKHRIPSTYTAPDPDGGAASPLVENCTGGLNPLVGTGFGGGVAFYSQNRVNSQMISRVQTTSVAWKYPYPGNDLVIWLNTAEITAINLEYNSGYNWQQSVSSDVAFDPDLPRSDRTPARFWWSLNKPQNSIADLYTIVLPLNYRDLDLTHSEIFHHFNVNGNLYTWQNTSFERQYIDNTGLVASTPDVVFGSSGVASQRGTQLSTVGTKHGFGVIKGNSAGGKETAYWIDTEGGKVMRFAESDGTVCLSDLQDMVWFFNNNLRFADSALTPADGSGICGVWDEQHGEAVWTVRAHKEVADWDNTATYNIGDEVFYQPVFPNYSTFEQTGEIYVSLINGNTSTPTNTADWELISHDNIDYYNEYTIAYSEAKKRFTTRYSHLPKIYLKRGKYVLSPRPVENENKCYEHYRGELCVWYQDASSVSSDIEQASDWFVDGMIINQDVNIDKHFLSLEMITEIAPERIDVVNKKYATFMVASDFEARGDGYVGAVKNDTLTATVSQLNEQDTSSIFGSHASFKLSGSPRIYQKLFDFICKMKINSRTYNT